MSTTLYESDLEDAALGWFADLGYEVATRDALDPDGPHGERDDESQPALVGRLRAALHHLNPDLPADAVEEAMRRVLRRDAPTLVQDNAAFHQRLADGVTVEVPGEAGGVRGVIVRLVDAERPEENDWLVARQVRVSDRVGGTGQARIADVVVYLNGLPVAVLELKNPTANATAEDAWRQLQTYVRDVPSLFATNVLMVASDDVDARVGPLGADWGRFGPWRAVDDEGDEPRGDQPLRTLVRGVFERGRLLDLARNFVTFEGTRDGVAKKLAGYHQFHAVRRAVRETVRASAEGGDRKVGVVWHTQGSGKSLTMVFYARKLVLEPAMENPTVVVLTDRNDLDDQLFGTFSRAQALLRQEPVQADDRAALRRLLTTASGGVYFTTVQKFLPPDGEPQAPLSTRRNIVVVADEAHRSQYGFKARLDRDSGKLVYGLAKHLRDALPHASYVGFTGTPVDLDDKVTTQVFGGYVSVYDIRRAVDDRATVPIYYENRLARLDLDERERPQLDARFEEVTEGEEAERKEALKGEWATLETLASTPKRVGLIAADLVAHFERRTDALAGKAMVVCMSRRICVDLHDAIRALRPEWFDGDDDRGAVKVVMTGGASDGPELQPHVRTKARRERLAERFKDADDPLRVVIVRDMWLTGFDAPCLHTLYVDKPMRGHNLMQAIARVNRVWADKPGGLVVDYMGVAPFLKEAMATYAASGGQGDATGLQEQAAMLLLEKLEGCRDLFHGFDYRRFFTGTPGERLALLPAAREHVLAMRQPAPAGAKARGAADGHDRFLQTAAELTRAFALAMPHETCERVRDEVAFFQAVRVGLVKLATPRGGGSTAIGHAIRQIIASAVVTHAVVDVFEAAGLRKPDLSVLSEEFLAEVEGMAHKNLAAALLQRVLDDEIRARSRRNVVEGRRFSDLLAKAIARYQSRAIDVLDLAHELRGLAVDLRESARRGEALSLTREESAFYDALAQNQSARDVMGDPSLATLTALVRKNATIDWQNKRSVQAKLRSLVKRLLRERGYPPDQQASATELVLEQAKALGINFVAGAADRSDDVEKDDAAEPPPPTATTAAPTGTPRPLPYPIAVFDAMVAAQVTPMLRVKTRRDGIERALAFLVGLVLSTLREAAGGARSPEVLALLKDVFGRPISMGTWLTLAWRLGARLPADAADPVTRAARAFVTPEGKASELTRALEAVVTDRNDFSHGVTASESAFAADEAPLHALWHRLCDALAPLAACELVSPAAVLDAPDATGTMLYQVRVHQGSSDRFPVDTRRIAGSLHAPWCYLLRPDATPLALDPVVACLHDDGTGAAALFLARTLSFDAGAKVDAMAVASSSKARLVVA